MDEELRPSASNFARAVTILEISLAAVPRNERNYHGILDGSSIMDVNACVFRAKGTDVSFDIRTGHRWLERISLDDQNERPNAK
jgi:hypothetical protein